MPVAAPAAPLRLGLIADIQYADVDDVTNFGGREHRHFRNVLQVTEAAVECWNACAVDTVVQLGDIIDGRNSQLGTTEVAMRTIFDILKRSTAKQRFDLIGNHELYNFGRADLRTCGLHCCNDEGSFYYSAHLNQHWEAIVLDPFEYTLIGKDEQNPSYLKAVELLRINNPRVLEQSTGDWFEGLPADRHRFVPYNGGISSTQLAWLDMALSAAEAEHRSVLVFTHVPLFEPATHARTTLWNCEEVLAVLHAHRDSVVAVFAGHDHNGGYAIDSKGLHHITLASPLSATPGMDCCAILECHDDGWAHFVSHGRACVESKSYGRGRVYQDLVLSKGVEHGLIKQDVTAMRAALSAALEYTSPPQVDSGLVEQCMTMSFAEENAQCMLEMARRTQYVAMSRL